MFNYIPVAKIESHGKNKVGVSIDIALPHRKLTDEEKAFISRKAGEIAEMIYKYNLLEDKEYMSEVAKFIHDYGYEKATEYLKKLLNTCTK